MNINEILLVTIAVVIFLAVVIKVLVQRKSSKAADWAITRFESGQGYNNAEVTRKSEMRRTTQQFKK